MTPYIIIYVVGYCLSLGFWYTIARDVVQKTEERKINGKDTLQLTAIMLVWPLGWIIAFGGLFAAALLKQDAESE